MRNHSNENEFDLHENGPEGNTHFHLNDFARRLVLKWRQMVTRKWPISFHIMTSCLVPMASLLGHAWHVPSLRFLHETERRQSGYGTASRARFGALHDFLLIRSVAEF